MDVVDGRDANTLHHTSASYCFLPNVRNGLSPKFVTSYYASSIMLGARRVPPDPAKAPHELILLVTLVGWRPSENLFQDRVALQHAHLRSGVRLIAPISSG